jgi:hypothetical protein
MTDTPVRERPGRDGLFLVLPPPKPALAGYFFLHAFANRTSPREVQRWLGLFEQLPGVLKWISASFTLPLLRASAG